MYNFSIVIYFSYLSAIYTYLLVYFSQVSSSSANCDQCLVSAPAGTFYGFVNNSILTPEFEFCNYLGILYGTCDRFEKPKPVKRVDGTYNATSNGPECPQLSYVDGSPVGDENCLYLNVYVPKLPRKGGQLKSVIVFIHGGGFRMLSGSSQNFLPEYLLERDVIVVTINYRLNLFGWLNLGIPECGGNMGLWDQALALKWVQKNIKCFGGNPQSVTLMGHSAGAISSYLHSLSPVSEELFQKIIVISAITPDLVKNSTALYSIEYVKHMKYKGDLSNRYEMVNYLKQLDVNVLQNGYGSFVKKLIQIDVTFTLNYTNPFWPSIDAPLGKEAFLPNLLEDPTMNARSARKIPILVGQTNMDAIVYFFLYKVPEIITRVKTNLRAFLSRIYPKNKHVNEEVINRVKKYYFNQHNNENELTKTTKFLTFLSYFNFYKQNSIFYNSLQHHEIFAYQFCYDGDGAFEGFKTAFLGPEYASTIKGVAHGDDLLYHFYSETLNPNVTFTNDNRKIIYEVTKLWTNFAKTGNPNSNCDDIEFEWKAICPVGKNYGYLRIDNVTRFFRNCRINEKEWKFWENLLHTS